MLLQYVNKHLLCLPISRQDFVPRGGGHYPHDHKRKCALGWRFPQHQPRCQRLAKCLNMWDEMRDGNDINQRVWLRIPKPLNLNICCWLLGNCSSGWTLHGGIRWEERIIHREPKGSMFMHSAVMLSSSGGAASSGEMHSRRGRALNDDLNKLPSSQIICFFCKCSLSAFEGNFFLIS